MGRRWSCAGMLLALAAFAWGDVDVTVSGRVVDGSGLPMADVDVATSWVNWKNRLQPSGGVSTESDGRFHLETKTVDWPVSLMAADSKTHTGTIVLLAGPDDAAKEVTLTLAPFVNVLGAVKCPALDDPIETLEIEVWLGGAHVGTWWSKGPKFLHALPPADYELKIATPDTWAETRTVHLVPGGADTDLGTIELKALEVARAYGKPAPALQFTDARGLPRNFTWEAMAGKWVLLVFWDCGARQCVVDLLPGLARFYESHAKDRDRFEIVAFHAGDAGTIAEVDQRLQPIVESLWHGKELPFPVAVDPSGDTKARYSVHFVPTEYLIDPRGRLVRGGSLEGLSEILAKGDPDVTATVESLKRAKTEEEVRPLLDRLAEKGTPPARAALLAFAKAPPKGMLALALEALGRAGGKEALQYLLGLGGLASKDPAAQDAAAVALGLAKDPEAIDNLLAVVLDRKARPSFACAALDALGAIDPADERVKKWSLEAAKTTNAEVKVAAIRLLGRVATDEAYARLLLFLHKDFANAARIAAAEALAATKRPEAKAVLEKAAAEDRAPDVRAAAAKAAASM
jgi:hypothetical protein